MALQMHKRRCLYLFLLIFLISLYYYHSASTLQLDLESAHETQVKILETQNYVLEGKMKDMEEEMSQLMKSNLELGKMLKREEELRLEGELKKGEVEVVKVEESLSWMEKERMRQVEEELKFLKGGLKEKSMKDRHPWGNIMTFGTLIVSNEENLELIDQMGVKGFKGQLPLWLNVDIPTGLTPTSVIEVEGWMNYGFDVILRDLYGNMACRLTYFHELAQVRIVKQELTNKIWREMSRTNFKLKEMELTKVTIFFNEKGMSFKIQRQEFPFIAFDSGISANDIRNVQVECISYTFDCIEVTRLSINEMRAHTPEILKETEDRNLFALSTLISQMNSVEPLNPISQSDVYLEVYVITSPERLRLRMAQRKLWFSYDLVKSGKIVIRYVTGVPLSPVWKKGLELEHQRFGDVNIVNAPDHYFTVMHKTAAIYTSYAANTTSPWILCTNDDMFIHLPKVIEILEKQNTPLTMWGEFHHNTKWPNLDDTVTDFHRYQNGGFFYPRGGGYAVSRDLVKVFFFHFFFPFSFDFEKKKKRFLQNLEKLGNLHYLWMDDRGVGWYFFFLFSFSLIFYFYLFYLFYLFVFIY